MRHDSLGAIDWGDLRYLLTVVRTGTVSGAARQLRVDHATVIRHIARLEQRTRTTLFLKHRSGYEITEAGRRLLQTAETVESIVVEGYDALTGVASSLQGYVRIGAPDGFGTSYLPSRLDGFATSHPNLQLQLVATARLFSLWQRDADLAVSVTVPATGRLLARKLVDYRLGLFASQAYLDSSPPIRGRDDLPAHRFIGYIEELIFTPELDYLHLVHPQISAQFRSGNLVAQMNAALHGMGIAVLPYFMAAGALGLRTILPKEVHIDRSFWLLTHPDTARSSRIRAVADFLVETVRRDVALFTGPAFRGEGASTSTVAIGY